MRYFLAALIGAGLCGNAQSPLSIPDSLKPPATEKLVLQARAEGDQVYTCDGSKWALSGPDAKLLDESGKQVGTHFSGPTWQWSDGEQGGGAAHSQCDARSGFNPMAPVNSD